MNLLVAVGLVEHHRERWRARSDSSDNQSAAEHTFDCSQFRRRVVASGLIALVGALLIADYFVEFLFASLLIIVTVLLLLGIIFILAACDLLRIRNHFHAHREGAHHARRALLDEAERLLAEKHLRDNQQGPELPERMGSPHDTSKCD